MSDAATGRGARPFGPSAQEVRALLLENYERLASDLTGTAPERRRHLNDPLRFPHMGGFEVHTHGPKAGAWYSHSEGKGGGPIEMIRHFRGGDFKEAMTYSRGWLGLSDNWQPKPPDKAALAAREAAQAARTAELVEYRQRRLDFAGKLWGERQPVEGTVAERYLTETRGIPKPPGGWPDAIAYHPQRQALALAATNDAGELRGVHMVYLTKDAQKIGPEEVERRKLKGAKMSYGLITEGAIRFPGDRSGPVLQGEGPETGLSAWAATGMETRLALSGVGRLEPEAGRKTVLLRDDDKPGSPADKAITDRITEWRAAGKDVVSAFPWPEHRGDKSDFNDLVKAAGANAVRERINTVLAREAEKMSGTQDRQAAEPSDYPLSYRSVSYAPTLAPAAQSGPEPPQTVTRQLSEDGMMALGAVYSKIDREWSNKTPQEREALKEQAVKSMAAHEAENGDVSLSPDQRRALLRERNSTRQAEPERGPDLERLASVIWIKPVGGEQTTDQAKPDKDKPDPATAWRDSEAVLRSYYIENHPNARLYYKSHKDTDPAIVAAENKIQGAQGDAKTIRSMLDIAEARGWKDLDVGGGKQHAQELWIEAKSRGINVRGYEATERDTHEAARREAQRTIRQKPDPIVQEAKQQAQGADKPFWQNREGGKERQRNR